MIQDFIWYGDIGLGPVLDPSSCLATADVGRKVGLLCLFFWGGEAGSP